MSVEYIASGGIGFIISDDILNNAYLYGKVVEDRFEKSPYDELERVTKNTCLLLKEYGNIIVSEPKYMVVINADTLGEILILKDLFVEKFNEVFGTTKASSDLEIIVESYIL